MNDGAGAQATDEGLAQAVATVAHAVARNEHAAPRAVGSARRAGGALRRDGVAALSGTSDATVGC